MSALTHCDLFSGIGGFSLAAQWAGFTTVQFVELDPFCRRVLAKHWPEVPCHDDIRTYPVGPVGDIDLLTGGFPCQDISVAGSGAGIDGERSGLWSELARLIGTIRPRYAVVENSPALLYRGMGRVLSDLAACGYDAEWDCIPASAVGAPHQRDRLFIVAYPHTSDGPARMGHIEVRPAPLQQATMRGGYGLRSLPASRSFRGHDGLSRVLDRHRRESLGNALVPAQVAPILVAIAAHLRGEAAP